MDADSQRLRYNQRMRQYMAKRYAARRQQAIEFLGGLCVRCGSTEELELDHIDRRTKAKPIAKLILAAPAKLHAELVKCQVLCRICHLDKTKQEREIPHGGGAKGRRYCRCGPCVAAVRRYNQEYKKRSGVEQVGSSPAS